MDFLQTMAERSRQRVEAAKRQCSEAEMVRRAFDAAEPLPLKLSPAGFDLIAEIKLRSPAVGELKQANESIDARAAAYAAAGATAVSVLTEPSRFDGSMEHLKSAAEALAPSRIPTMRKDFLVDPYQIAEARAAGAGGVLIILRMLPRSALQSLLHAVRHLEMFALLEAFDEEDIELAHELVSQQSNLLVGVNCRDLTTLQVVPGRLEQLAPLLPRTAPRVAESGVESIEHVKSVVAAGYNLALVGSALMKSNDPAGQVQALLAAGRKA